MKSLVVVLTACSSKSSAPPPPAPGSGSAVHVQPKKPPLPPAPTMKSSKPIDLLDAGITELQLIPTGSPGSPSKGEFDIFWRSKKQLESGVVCRVESYNLFANIDTYDSPEPDKHAVSWHPDPFVLDPEVCEARFVDAHGNAIASACYRAGNMTAGPCPAGTFPPPKMDPGQVIDVQGATVQTIENQTTHKRDAVSIKALYTVAAPLDHVSFDATCDGVTTGSMTADDFIPLAKLRPGETTFAYNLPLAFRKPLAKERPDKCELHASMKGKRLGTFCIAEGQTERGPCST